MTIKGFTVYKNRHFDSISKDLRTQTQRRRARMALEIKVHLYFCLNLKSLVNQPKYADEGPFVFASLHKEIKSQSAWKTETLRVVWRHCRAKGDTNIFMTTVLCHDWVAVSQAHKHGSLFGQTLVTMPVNKTFYFP